MSAGYGEPMADTPRDFTARAAADLGTVRATMRDVDGKPDWPAGLGEAELVRNDNGTPSWRFSTATYTLDGDTLAEVRTVPPLQARLINVRTRAVKRVPLTRIPGSPRAELERRSRPATSPVDRPGPRVRCETARFEPSSPLIGRGGQNRPRRRDWRK